MSHGGMSEGEIMFRGQCMNCHTVDGYRSMRRLMHGRDRKSIANMTALLHESPATSPYKKFMPPLVGTPQEIDSLTSYLNQLVNSPNAAVARRE